MGITLVLQKTLTLWCSPGPISQKKNLLSSFNLPVGKCKVGEAGMCPRYQHKPFFLRKNNHFEPYGMSSSRKNYVQEGTRTWKCLVGSRLGVYCPNFDFF